MGAMQPIGLTLKATHKKYGPARSGELMLIHQCLVREAIDQPYRGR
jgi:hypothetical protein